MTKIIIFLLACSTCELEKIEMFKPLYQCVMWRLWKSNY